MGDSTSLQGGTLVLTELQSGEQPRVRNRAGTGFGRRFRRRASAAASVNKNYTGAGRIPNGAVIARDMITPLQTDQSGFNYVLTTPDYKTAANLGGRAERSLRRRHRDGARRRNRPRELAAAATAATRCSFLPTRRILAFSQDELAKVVMNERTGTIVFGGNIKLAPCAIAHGDLTITIATQNQVVAAESAAATGKRRCSRTRQIQAAETRQAADVHRGRCDALVGRARAEHAGRLAARPHRDRASVARVRLAASRRGDHLMADFGKIGDALNAAKTHRTDARSATGAFAACTTRRRSSKASSCRWS